MNFIDYEVRKDKNNSRPDFLGYTEKVHGGSSMTQALIFFSCQIVQISYGDFVIVLFVETSFF